MTIRDKTPLERTAMQFKSAGLGDRSAWEAARLLCHAGMSFETAAVMGQRLDEACTATPATIREAAGRYRRATEAPRTTTAWGRPVQEATDRQEAASRGTEAPVEERRTSPKKSASGRGRIDNVVVIDGVPHHQITEYEPAAVSESVTEQEKPTRTPWGRKLED